MLEAGIVIIAAVILARTLMASRTAPDPALAPKRISPQLAAAVTYADRLFAEKKWLAAEKAYVNVLKLDHKNLTAYSHLGIIYSTQKNLADAIECFQIAVRLRPSGSTYQNLAMAYYENRNYMKSISAYDKAIMFEPTASRYIGQSKAYKKVSNSDKVVACLQQAVALDPSVRIQELLVAALHDADRPQEAKELERAVAAGPAAAAPSSPKKLEHPA